MKTLHQLYLQRRHIQVAMCSAPPREYAQHVQTLADVNYAIEWWYAMKSHILADYEAYAREETDE